MGPVTHAPRARVNWPEDLATAVALWKSLSGNGVDPGAAEVLKESEKSRVYRLTAAGPRGGSVIAKRRRTDEFSTELLWYRTLGDHIQIRKPELYATTEVGSDTWLMLEDIGDERYDSRKHEHRAALTRWLLAIHRDATPLGRSGLPSHDSERYFAHLVSARSLIEENLGNPALTADDRDVLDDVLATLATAESRWPDIQAICAWCPSTLVHGDLSGKNVRIVRSVNAIEAAALDWETAGWGLPAPDLSVSPHRSLSPCPMLGQYGRDPDRLGGMSRSRLRQLAVAGTLFRGLAAPDWVCVRLATPHVRRPLRHLVEFRGAVDSTLARLSTDRTAH